MAYVTHIPPCSQSLLQLAWHYLDAYLPTYHVCLQSVKLVSIATQRILIESSPPVLSGIKLQTGSIAVMTSLYNTDLIHSSLVFIYFTIFNHLVYKVTANFIVWFKYYLDRSTKYTPSATLLGLTPLTSRS